ncbi:interferon-induced very large GTPase 1 [Corythoichthys intestinalis]|uniref:interferon-induced very large GTPase 1 n=1 Tax=Corythoichthys intestinalis TaxID=161448 RepID=UPI0025A56208|nr:interferon-induced very large GTPase 1 [Corythoichthys intestinalis]
MSTKLTKKPSSKRKKHPKNTTKFEVLTQLGLEDFYPSQLEPASILDLSTWILDNLTAREPNDLPKSFLQRLWLLRPDARHTCCKALSDATENLEKKPANLVGSIACTIHPLDLVTAVYQCSNTFLQQEMTAHMLHCRFAVPLVLPYVDDKEPSSFLLWPLRGVVRQWHSQSVDGDQKIQEAILASTSMPIISCVRLGSCSVSKSEVLNHVISSETFVHKGMEGGQLPRNLSNGLVETAWYLPLGDPVKDNFVVPVVFCNLRGDACMHEKCLSLLSQASSAVIVLCENPEGREKQLLASWQDITAKLIVIDLSKTKTTEDRMVKFSGKNLQEELGLPLGSVISGTGLNAEKLANVLCQNIKHLLPDLRLVTLEGAAKLAVEQGFDCDEGAVCKKTMATAEEILKGLNEGAAVFRQKQLPLQGALWSRLAEIDKEESRRKKERKEFDFQLQNEKKDILRSLSKYKNTQSMKNFTNAISTTDKFERMYFLNWMRVKLRLLQRQKEIDLKDLLINQQTEEKSSIPELSELQNGTKDLWHDSTSFCTDSTFEDEENLEFTDSHQVVTDSGNEVDLKSISRTKDNERSESLLSEHLDSNEKEIPGEEIFENDTSLSHIPGENVNQDDLWNGFGKSIFHNTTYAEEQTCQETFTKVETTPSVHSCLLRLEQQIGNDLEVAYSGNDLDSKHSFLVENREETESLPERNCFSLHEKEVLSEGILEANVSLNTVFIDNETGVKNGFETQNTEELEELQSGLFHSPNQFAGEEIHQNNVSMNSELRDNTSLSVHGNYFSEPDSEIQMCKDACFEGQAITSPQPLLLQSECMTANDPELTDAVNEESSKHIFQNRCDEESDTLLRQHFDSSNEEILPEQIPEHVDNVSSNSIFEDKGALDVPGNNSIDSTHQKTTSVGQVASVEGETIKSELPCFLGLEHFFREMGLIFELTQINPGSGSHDELRLPSIAADLILSGVPLELMDGDASNLPMRWLCSVLAEIEHRFPRERFRTLTSLGAHHARNAEILSALFGVKFPDEPKRSTRGVYMVALQLPTKVKKKLNFDFLLLLDVEGLCCTSSDGQINEIIDNEMATVAAGMCDVLLQNIYSCSASELETNLTVAVNALLRIREYGSMPICKVLIQDEGINTILEATQLNRVSKILQIRTREQSLTDSDAINHNSKNKHSIVYVRPWYNEPLSKSINSQHSEAVLKLKRTLFGALKEASTLSGTSGMPEFMGRLYSVWEAVKAEASVCLQNKDIAFAFSLFCTELAKWEEILLDHMECWLTQATKTISSTKPEALDPSSQNDFLCELKYDAKREVKREVNKLKSNMKASLKENKLDVYIRILNTILSSYMIELEERITAMVIARLETINESHFSSTQFNRIETILETEQNVRLQGLLDRSASKNQLLHDKELEEEFEDVWKEALSKMEFRPSESEDITERVKNILAANIVRHGPQKHLNKLSAFGQNQTTHFRVDDQYFGYSSRMKNLFENQNKTPKAKAQQLSSNLMDYYQQFVAEKVSLPQDFSDSYITELLEMIDKTLKDSQLEIRTAFEVDLKVFICNAACKDFQRVHNRFAKDGELLKSFKAKKNAYMAQFIYQFRKRDQRQRFAQRFVSDIIQPTVMDYVYRPLGMQITEEIQSKVMQYRSPWAFHKSLLEELIQVDRFECFTEYLFSYDIFRMRKIQETVVAHLSEWNVNTWRHQRLGEIIGKVAAAASQVAEGTNAVLSDTKPLLEQVCLILEDEGVQIPWESLKGPTYSISTEWDCFVTCFMELLAALRLDLAQTFSQQLEIDELLELLPIQPKDCLFNKVNGCEARCPLCSAPCRVEKIRNHVHETSLHRPKCILGSTSVITSESTILNDLDTQGAAVTCWELQPFNPEWNLSPEVTSSQTPCLYWRYVLARFNERFAMKYNQRPALIPDEWKAITQDEVLASLRDNFLPRENSSKES